MSSRRSRTVAQNPGPKIKSSTRKPETSSRRLKPTKTPEVTGPEEYTDVWNPEPVAKGSFGAVFKVKRTMREGKSKYLAFKVIGKGSNNLSKKDLQEYIDEEQRVAGFMAGLKNRFVVECLGSFYSSDKDALGGIQHKCFVFEWIEGGDMRDWMDKFDNERRKQYMDKGTIMKWDNTLLKEVASQILKGLEYLHDQCLVHRDIKPDNIMISEKAEVKITDFGLIMKLPSKVEFLNMNSYAGTHAYMAPEVWGSSITFRSDIWAVGCILYEMCTGKCPFEKIRTKDAEQILREDPENKSLFKNQEKNKVEIEKRVKRLREGNIRNKIAKDDIKWDNKIWGVDHRKFIESLMEKDWEKRATAREALKSPFFEVISSTSTKPTKSSKTTNPTKTRTQKTGPTADILTPISNNQRKQEKARVVTLPDGRQGFVRKK